MDVKQIAKELMKAALPNLDYDNLWGSLVRERFESAIARLMPQRRAVKDKDGAIWEPLSSGRWFCTFNERGIAQPNGFGLAELDNRFGPLTELSDAFVCTNNCTTEKAKPEPQPFNIGQAIAGIRETLRARLLQLIDTPNDNAANIARQVIDAMNLLYRLNTHPAIVDCQVPF